MTAYLLLPLLAVPASANAALGYFPVNYAYHLEMENNVPTLHIDAQNNADKETRAFETVIFPKDAAGNALRMHGNGANFGTILARNVDLVKKGDIFEGKIALPAKFGAGAAR